MVFGHSRLEQGCGLVLGVRLISAPLHEQAVAEAAEQAHDEHAGREADAAAVVVLGDVQALVQAIFDATKTLTVQIQPLLGVELVGWGAGQQRDRFVVPTVGLPEQAGGLGGKGEAHLLWADRLGED